MKLETIKNSLFALDAAEAAAVFGGYAELQAPAATFTHGTTFYKDGTSSPDSYETD